MKKKLATAFITAVLAQTAHATIVLDFEGAGNNAQLLNFYNGGTDSAGNSGTNYGIGFGSNALALIDADDGGGGNFANEPSSKTIMFFLSGSAILNYAAGFDTGFSFFYSSSTAASVKVYDGVDATGNLLADIPLTAQFNLGCTGDPNGNYCNWTAVGAGFAGIAKSIDFGGTIDQVAYDNITFGSSTPGTVPEPASLALIGAGLAAILRTRRSSTQR